MVAARLNAPSARPRARTTQQSVRANRIFLLWALLPVALTVACGFVLTHATTASIGGLGLIQALPALYFVLTGMLLVSAILAIRSDTRAVVLAAHIIGLVMVLHGAAGFLEPVGRFPTAWLHAGFTDEIIKHRTTIPSLDARFDWPGFFAGAAALVGASGLKSPVALLQWAPVAAVLSYLMPIYVIALRTTRSRRVAWTALIIFILIDWVGQDYFAPESLGFFLYLAIVAILIATFHEGGRVPSLVRGVYQRFVGSRADDFTEAPLTMRTRMAVLFVALVAMGALAVSHQLSPVVLVMAVALLVVLGQSRLRALPLLAAAITVGWISVGATPYWVGHFSTIAGGFGNVGTVVTQNVSNRVASTNVDHTFVVRARLAFSGVVWVAAGLIVVMRYVKRNVSVPVAVLAFAPFVILLGQSYGGEAILRVFLFSSPFCAILIAQAARPAFETVRRTIAIMVIALIAVPIFLVAFNGNERFERIYPGDVSAVRKFWQVAPKGSLVVGINANIPWRFEHLADYKFESSAETNFENMRFQGLPFLELIMSVNAPKGDQYSYLLVTKGAIQLAEQFHGARPGWFRDTRKLLTPDNGFDLIYRNKDASLYRFELFTVPGSGT